MALIPQPTRTTPAAGYPGMWQNMEECNSFTAFAEEEFGFGIPLALGTGEMGVVELTDGERFVGISLSNIYTSGTPVDGQEIYGVGDKLGVADEGVLFVRAGGTIAKGDVPFYDPTDKSYYAASATGRLPLPNCEFDGSGIAGEAVALRVRIVPGGEAVEAAT